LKNYELLTVFKPNLDADEVEKNLSKIEKDIKKFGGSIVESNKIGRKKLAYEIQKFRDGFLVSQVISLPEDKVADFKRLLRLNDSILRIMFLDVTKKYAVK